MCTTSFGGIVLTSFLFQAGSGFSLTIYYQPTVVEAFPSVQFILHHVNLGWFIQSIHRWSSERIHLDYRYNSSSNYGIVWC